MMMHIITGGSTNCGLNVNNLPPSSDMLVCQSCLYNRNSGLVTEDLVRDQNVDVARGWPKEGNGSDLQELENP